MPIIIPEESENLGERLRDAGAAVISETTAIHQDIRPARVGILNLMPAATMEKTEIQWLKYMSHTVLQIEPVLIKFDEDFRERAGASRSKTLERYKKFSSAVDSGLDGLIVTGDNIELNDTSSPDRGLLDFSKVTYANQLAEVIDWARSNVYSSIYSCWASHFSLNHLFGLNREQMRTKVFGVYDHEIISNDSQVVEGMDDTISSPHSRWGNIPTEQLESVNVTTLATSSLVGWLIAQSVNNSGGIDIFVQGHPEYDRYDLHEEYQRDEGENQELPENYYDPQSETPKLTWANDARALHSNWVTMLYNNFTTNNSLYNILQ